MRNNIIIHIVLLVILLSYPEQVKAQEAINEIDIVKKVYTPATGIRAAITGSIVHPGFQVGVERPYTYTQINKLKMRGIRTFYKERYVSFSLGMYHHNNYHTNLFLQTEWIARRQKSKGWYVESALGMGFSKTFVDGATYTVSDDGNIEKVAISGNVYALASLGGGIGYNANITKQKPYAVYVKHQWMLLFPYNAFITARPTLLLGIHYNLTGFWKAKPKSRFKEKQSRQYKNTQNL